MERRQARVEEELAEMRRVMAAIAHRFGVLSESAFREAMKYVVEEPLGGRNIVNGASGIITWLARYG